MEKNNLEKEYWGKSFYGSKLNTILLLVLIVLMVFALRFMYQNQDYYVDNLKSESDTNKTTDVSQKLNSPEPEVSWRWGKFTFKLPFDWEARSADSGAGSALVVSRSASGDFYPNSVLLISGISNCDYDVPEGEKPSGCITQQEFVDNMGNRSKLDGKLISQEQTIFLGRNAIKQIVEINNNQYFRYYLEGFDYTYFALPINTEDSTILLSVLSSINLNPTSNELASAKNTP